MYSNLGSFHNRSVGVEYDNSVDKASKNQEFEVYASKYSYRAFVRKDEAKMTKLQQINQKYINSSSRL